MPVIHEITDLTAPELDVYARLTHLQLIEIADNIHYIMSPITGVGL